MIFLVLVNGLLTMSSMLFLVVMRMFFEVGCSLLVSSSVLFLVCFLTSLPIVLNSVGGGGPNGMDLFILMMVRKRMVVFCELRGWLVQFLLMRCLGIGCF